MPIIAPVERYAQSRTVQGATTTFSPTGTIAVGSLAVIGCTSSIDGKIPSSVTDDAGNTWAVDVSHNATIGNENESFASTTVTTQLTTGSVITINWAVSTNNQVHIWLQEVTGQAASPFDKSATGESALAVAGTALTTSATATLSQAAEVVFVIVRGSDLTGIAVGSGYTQATTLSLGAAPPLSALQYKITTATTAVSGSFTHSATTEYGELLATYKAATVQGAAALTGTGSMTVAGTATTPPAAGMSPAAAQLILMERVRR